MFSNSVTAEFFVNDVGLPAILTLHFSKS